MAVIIALFTGLTMSADEIIKDRKIRTRESFLNLSRNSYLLSKVFILFVIAAYQALAFTLIGNSVLHIKDMYWEYWLILFTTWASSIMMGLNISDGFKTSVTIYILIPFLIIPQIVLSGIIVRYEKLNPALTNPGTIPWFGEIITARWAYEALATYQFIENKYEKPIYKYERIKHEANFKKDLIVSNLRNKISYYERHKNELSKENIIKEDLSVIRNEISKELKQNKKVTTNLNLNNIFIDKITSEDIAMLKTYLSDLKQYYINRYKLAEQKEDNYIYEQTKTPELNEKYIQLKRDYHNEALEEIVTNKNELKKILEYKGHLYQKTDMIYTYPERIIISQFYAPKKKLFDGKYYPTFWINLVIIWLFTILLYFMLYFSIIKKTFLFFENLRYRIKEKNEQKY